MHLAEIISSQYENLCGFYVKIYVVFMSLLDVILILLETL